MNVRDSEHIIAELNDKENYVLTDTLAEADLILVNTCSVREKPVSKLFSEIGKYNLKKRVWVVCAGVPQAIWAKKFLNEHRM